jgi:hypothetical protein
MSPTSSLFLSSIQNHINDIKRETIHEIIQAFEDKNILTDIINTELLFILKNIKKNKKKQSVKRPRFSGYHLFMKEHRLFIKESKPSMTPQELTTIVSKAWKNVPEYDKNLLKERAMEMKNKFVESCGDEVGGESKKRKLTLPPPIVIPENILHEDTSDDDTSDDEILETAPSEIDA